MRIIILMFIRLFIQFAVSAVLINGNWFSDICTSVIDVAGAIGTALAPECALPISLITAGGDLGISLLSE